MLWPGQPWAKGFADSTCGEQPGSGVKRVVRSLLLSIVVAGCVWPSPAQGQAPPCEAFPTQAIPTTPALETHVGSDGFGAGQPEASGVVPSMPGMAEPSPSEMLGQPVVRLPPVDLEERPRPRSGWLREIADDVVMDYRNFYQLGNLAALGAGLGVGAAMANTATDEKIRDFWQENVRSASTDEYLEAFHAPKVLGDGTYMLPAYAGAALVGLAFEEGTFGRGLGDWGSRSLRTIGVGAPMMLALQYATGGSRPEEGIGSGWHAFQSTHGVSGHAFMGAVPLLNAAKMVESPVWKTAFYAGSTLPGLSRVNDDHHYASQVVLGWWIAYLAATAVDRTSMDRQNVSVGPIAVANGVGIGLEWRR